MRFRTKWVLDLKGNVISCKTYYGKELELLENREERKKKLERIESKWYRWTNIKANFHL